MKASVSKRNSADLQLCVYEVTKLQLAYRDSTIVLHV
jgi:hypothetical protein